jgi:hypothetical protein
MRQSASVGRRCNLSQQYKRVNGTLICHAKSTLNFVQAQGVSLHAVLFHNVETKEDNGNIYLTSQFLFLTFVGSRRWGFEKANHSGL